MGIIQHHAILATTWNAAAAGHALNWCEKNHVHAVKGFSEHNNYVSLFVPPDGSHEGWSESEVGDSKRSAFIFHLQTYNYKDGSSPWTWVEVSYGERGANISETNAENLHE